MESLRQNQFFDISPAAPLRSRSGRRPPAWLTSLDLMARRIRALISAVAATGQDVCVVTVDDVRAVLAGLPRSSEVLVRDRVKFRVGQIVYVAFSQDETEIGFAFPEGGTRRTGGGAAGRVLPPPRVGAALPLD